jgi:hypothetical protein
MVMGKLISNPVAVKETSQKAQAFEEGRFPGGLWLAITE